MIDRIFDFFVAIDKKSGNILQSVTNGPFKNFTFENLSNLERFFLEFAQFDGWPIFEEWGNYIFVREVKQDTVFYFAIPKKLNLIKHFYALQESSMRDKLTTCYKKEYCNEFIEKLIKTYLRYKNEKFSVVMFDLDFFKKINDTYGHLCGDYVLKNLANIVRKSLRDSDIFCRFGGEEFIIVLPKTPASGTLRLTQRLKEAVLAHDFICNDQHFQISASFGVTTVGMTDSTASLIERADQALYQAKRKGRNRVEYL